ncbi:MAG TPA: hypothetical protein PK014_02715 [Thermoanaerobaculia bacterium]|nr:hypothetical protein [Thermoanaerobaculia bacterium]HUM28853.1 hypothetical protein [Thermoanaerobaculia bacterium]HXK67213.1 hypothetical protein [Thermoanaerobaculia bacterium]
MKVKRLHILYLAGLLIFLPFILTASVLETKTLDRTEEAVVLKGNQLPDYYGLMVNNSDPTLSPNQIFVWAYDEGSGWRQVVFQIDEINNARPTTPPPTCEGGYNVGQGPNYMEGDDGLWDSNDDLVFMSGETGDRVSLDEWAPDAVITAPRYEITITDSSINPVKKGWVYIFRYDSVPVWTQEDYVSWNETSNTVSADFYGVDYPDSHTSALYFTNLNVTPAAGGTGTNLVQKSLWYWWGGFGQECSSNETEIRTEITVTGGDCGTMVFPWYAKDGRVRILRYFIWMPYRPWSFSCYVLSNGVGMWPCVHHFYYRSYWKEDHNDKWHGGSSHTDYWYSTINHASSTTMTFYDSNGETATIDGVAETLAATPLWTWYQVSSPYGSYIKVLRDTAKVVSPDNRKNLYTDSGTGARGNAGYHIEDPTESTENAWDHFYYFFLPANASNQGELYNTIVDLPLVSSSTDQSFAVPPENFDGIQSATDVNGACEDEGVEITWDNVVDWNDSCSADCTNRKFVITRSGTLVHEEFNLTLSSWTDTLGANRTTYDYGVEACNQNNNCTDLGTTLEGVDYVSTAPVLGTSTTTAEDHDECTGDGVDITWNDPSDWRDNGEGSRQFDLYWESDGYTTPIQTDVTSPLLYDAVDGESHQYRIRAVNGCELFVNYTASAETTDNVGDNPTLPADPQVAVVDLDDCSPTGLQISWNPVNPWGDNGAGTSKYDLYWSRDGYTTPIVANATSPVTYVPPDSTPSTYRVIATNGCSLTATYTDGIGADTETAPNFAGVQSVIDSDGCAQSTLTISWLDVEGDGPEGWNDGGSGAGPRVYHIYRDMEEIPGSPVPDGITSITDQPPAPGTPYTYTVHAVNMDGCYRAGLSLPGSDLVAGPPVAALAETQASDECGRDEDPAQGVLISWDPVTDWGDNGTNTPNRRYYLYFSGNNFAAPIAIALEGTTSLTFNPVDNVPYTYGITARNGCSQILTYDPSTPVFDKTSCSPSCTVILDDDFDTVNSFTEDCQTRNLWNQTAGVGNGGSAAWQADLQGNQERNEVACLRMSSNLQIMWTTDVKLRFWSSVNLPASDAGVVEIWTDDSNLWRKITTIPYPAPSATVSDYLDDGTGSCATDVVIQNQPAFQGSVPGFVYEARLDGYLSSSTTQINIGFRVASDGDSNASTWTIDDVMIGYGIADSVWWWSLSGDLSSGVVKSGTEEANFSWEDAGIFQNDEFRIYRSDNPADIRNDPSSVLKWTEPDTDADVYTWTSDDGKPTEGQCWYYKVYGYKVPCGESNPGEN